MAGLSVARLINVDVSIGPLAAQGANFNSAMFVGQTDVIDVSERYRAYNTIEEVAADFAGTDPEYLAALNFFSQEPQPDELFIGRWAQSATAGLLKCGPLSAANQLMAVWTAIVDGAFKVSVDGAAVTALAGLNFSGAANLNAVAAIIDAALAGATVTWNGTNFVFKSGTTGPASSIGFLQVGAIGHIDISALLNGTAITGAQAVGGIAAESALAAVQALDGVRDSWYALSFAAPSLVDADRLAVAAYIEAASNKHIYGITTQAAAAIVTGDTTSIAYLIKAAGYNRTFVQYSSSSPYAAAGLIGRGVTVNFNGNNTVINFMWKQEPGVVPELLTASQANALNAINCNYFATFNNNTSIIVNGKVGSGAYIDEIWGMDWLANTVQTNVYNVLYTTDTKIPQTDAGTQVLITAVAQVMDIAVTNGFVAPGVWNSNGFGQLKRGQFLPTGYYIYAPRVADQLQADREARKSVPIQVAAKLAGAVNTADIQINVNR